ncbi:type II and III secretion system protein family protein [Limibacillus halophilus]|uniref:Pilus assembly protein CpaC n=1 Tax=Limibacillus halophilus TaxID=1579333 RepID=A0A839SUY1_9PROT|nr:type II and III secretion system protein family protein [Limibacillus halophilus]MBB3066282.1 pilus assembly protein CpaC [Limibacillus halophilus]
MMASYTRSMNVIVSIRSGFFATLIALLGLVVMANAATAQITIENGRDTGRHAGEIIVPLNKSQILRTQEPFTEIMIGNPEIADVVPLTNKSAYVLGRALGNTSITIYGAGRKLIAIGDLVVGYDVAGLKAKLYEVMPDERIEVRSVNDAVLLKGHVSSTPVAARAAAIAESYAPGKVQNGLSVDSSQQVMLQVRFAEVSRSVGKALGLSLDTSYSSGDFTFSGVTTGGLASAFGTIGIGGTLGALAIDATLDALETKGLVHSLAEPNLVVLSGDTASFLAGGEFPVPVAQDNDSITVEFKEFGVSLSFTPTVLDGDLINLIVRPEVSAIDPTRSFAVPGSGLNIPGLITRRAETTVELRDGQSFAIAGLYQSSYDNAIQQFPWLGDIPIIGALFRSSDFQQDESELVIIVTPRLVKPAQSPDDLRVPTDLYLRPNEGEFFLLGRTVGAGQGGTAAAPMAAGSAGGMAGNHGYILK